MWWRRGTQELCSSNVANIGEEEVVYLSHASMEGLPGFAPPPRNRLDLVTCQRLYPGLLATGIAAVAATWLAEHYHTPATLFALLFGLALNFLHEDGRCVPGIEFASRTLLRVGVALLGARITLEQIAALGLGPVTAVLLGVATTILAGVAGSRVLRLPRAFGVLSGGAVAICGASAALAIAAVLPQNKETQRDTVLAVVIVTTMSTIAMVVYPALVGPLQLDTLHAGLFLGGSIHDVAQVVGAAYTISPATGDVAIVIKLLRVALLFPVVMAIGFAFGAGAGVGRRVSVPLFLFGFAGLVVLRSIGVLPDGAAAVSSDVSRWCLVMAIAALGMKSSLKTLVAVGWRPVALVVVETLWIVAVMLAAAWVIR